MLVARDRWLVVVEHQGSGSGALVAGIGLMNGGGREKMEDARPQSHAKMQVSSEDSQASFKLTAVEKPGIT